MPNPQPGEARETETEAEKEDRKRLNKAMPEWQADLATAPVVKLEGFAKRSKQAELRRMGEERRKLLEKRERVKTPKSRKEFDDAIEELDTQFAKKEQEAQEEVQDETVSPLDEDAMRVLLKRAIPATLHSFIEQHCRFVYDKDAGERVELRKTDRIEFIFGPGAFKSKLETKVEAAKGTEYFDQAKLAFQIGRMVGALLKPPEGWENYRKGIRAIAKGKKLPEWEDFVGLYIMDRGQAEELSPEAAKSLDKAFVFGQLDFKQVSEHLAAGRSFDRAVLAPERQDTMSFKGRLKLFFKTLVPISYTDWYERFVAEFEDKEARRIITREEHVTGRDRWLAIYCAAGDKFQARTYLLSVAETSDQNNWRDVAMFLYHFDPLFRSTHGKQITKESYDFLMRLHRISNKQKRYGTKPAEYAPVTQPDGSISYGRQSRAAFEEQSYDEVEKKTPRELNNVAQELYEQMESEGRYFDLDERYGHSEAPFGKQIDGSWRMDQQRWERLKFQNEYGGDLGRLLGREKMAEIARYSVEDEGEGWYKTDPDKMMTLARWIAIVELANFIGPGNQPIPKDTKVPRDPFGTEHYRLSLRRAIDHHVPRIAEYREYRDQGGEPIPIFERFISYIDRYKRFEIGRALTAVPELSDKEQEAYDITQEEPIPSLSRAPEETVAKLKTVEGAIEGSGKGDKRKDGLKQKLEKELDAIKGIPVAFANEIKKDFGLLAELLRHPDELNDAVATIYNLTPPDEEASGEQKQAFELASRRYRDSCYDALVLLRPFYLRNRDRIDALGALRGWHNNFKPLLNAVKDKDKADVESESGAAREIIGQEFREPYFDDKGRFVVEPKQPAGWDYESARERISRQLAALPPEQAFKETDFYQELERDIAKHTRRSEVQLIPQERARWLYFQLKAYEAAIHARKDELENLAKKGKKKGEGDEEETAEPTPTTLPAVEYDDDDD